MTRPTGPRGPERLAPRMASFRAADPHRASEGRRDMGFRVIQWATGGVGRAAIEGVLDHPDLELVGAWVHSPDKDGVDLGTLVGRPPVGVSATGDIETLLALHADCVLYSPFMADRDVVAAILAS